MRWDRLPKNEDVSRMEDRGITRNSDYDTIFNCSLSLSISVSIKFYINFVWTNCRKYLKQYAILVAAELCSFSIRKFLHWETSHLNHWTLSSTYYDCPAWTLMVCQKKPDDFAAVILHNRAAVHVPLFGAVANLQLKVVFTLEHSQPKM